MARLANALPACHWLAPGDRHRRLPGIPAVDRRRAHLGAVSVWLRRQRSDDRHSEGRRQEQEAYNQLASPGQ